MIIFYIVLGLGIGGIGFVLWNMKNESESQKVSIEEINPELIGSLDLKESFSVASNNFSNPTNSKSHKTAKSKIPFSFKNLITAFTGIIQKVKVPALNKNKVADSTETYLLKDKLANNPFNTPNVKFEKSFGTSSIKTQPVSPEANPQKLNPEDIKKIENEIDLTAQLNEMKDKYERLEKILNDKNSEFDKIQEAYNHEQKNRKEFNKIKDLLEKELKESKDQIKEAQSQSNQSKTESEGYKKRILQLEEKATKLEKEILKKEEEIDTLLKRLQTFASPTTAATPPKKEPLLTKVEPITIPAPIESNIEPVIELKPEIPLPTIPDIQIIEPITPTKPEQEVSQIKILDSINPNIKEQQESILNLDLNPDNQKTAKAEDLNLQPPTPTTEEIKNIVDILSSPQQSIELTNDEQTLSPDDSNEPLPYIKLNPDIASEDYSGKEKPQNPT